MQALKWPEPSPIPLCPTLLSRASIESFDGNQSYQSNLPLLRFSLHRPDDGGAVVVERQTQKVKPPQMYQVVHAQ